MAIKKIITVDGIEVPFKASATLPRLYRAKFRKDIFKDFSALKTSVDESDEENSGLGIESLEVFENIAWTMAKHADPENVPDRPMTTPLFLLRCVQIGLSLTDLDLLTIGMVNEMFIEKDNDEATYSYKAQQSDFDSF